MNTPVTVAFLADQRSHVAACAPMPWQALTHDLITHTAGEKEGAAWMPARIDPGPRTGNRVQAVTALVLDVEAATARVGEGKQVIGPLPPPLEEVAQRLRALGVAAALATTHSHEAPTAGGGTLGPRYRVVLPLSRELSPRELRTLAMRVAAELGLTDAVDKTCMEPARLLYLPRCPAERMALAQRAVLEGAPWPVPLGLDVVPSAPSPAAPTMAGSEKWQAMPEAEQVRVVAELREALGAIPADDYHVWTRIGHALKGDLPHDVALELWAPWSQTSPNFQDGDLDRFETFKPDHTGYGAVFKVAAEHGWQNPRSAAAIDFSAVGFGVDVTLPRGARPVTPASGTHTAPPAANAARFKLWSGADLRALPPLAWRVRGVVPAQGLAALYGPSGSGKSFLALDMAAAIAEGSSWFECRVTAAPVVYAALEGEAGFKLRTLAWERSNGRPLPACLHMVLQPFKLTAPDDVRDLAAAVPAGAVLFLDTLNRTAPTADENSSRDMGEILEAAKALQSLTGGLVVLIHHTGKDAGKGPRGHSSLPAALDAAVEVSRDGGARRWTVFKAKDGEDGWGRAFRLEVVTLGPDDEGDMLTSCIVRGCEPSASTHRTKPPTGGNQRLVWDALPALMQQKGRIGLPGIPPMRPSIDLEEAIESVAPRLTCEPGRRKERAREAISGLAARKLLGIYDGRLWLE